MQNSSIVPKKKIGVVLMTYGSATTSEYVREYMDHIYRGKASEEVIKDFEERYRLVGHSPLVELTEEQARLLEKFLNDHAGDHDEASASEYVVRVGMLHSKPFIEDALRDCKNAGAQTCVGIILSPQFSSFIMDGYGAAFGRAALACGFSQDQIKVVGPWPTEPHFIKLLAERISRSAKMPLVFTTHSLPKRVVDKDPQYLEQLRSTINAVLAELKTASDISDLEWHEAYQSAGHTPEEWLKPDLTDILAQLKEKKAKAVLIVPIQFLTDHLEILYDLDIAARAQCESFGIAYHRIDLPNTDPLFIEALGSLVKTALQG